VARHGPNLVVEIKGYRGEDAKEKKSTMDNYWVPGVNRLGSHGRWAFAEFTDVYAMQHEFADKIEEAFDGMIGRALRPAVRLEGHAHRAERRPE
jgi:type III restriction enzyme